MTGGQTVRRSLPQWWQDRKRKWPWVVAALLLILFVIAGIFGDRGAQSGDKPAVTVPSGLTGMDAASARDRLEDLGFQVTMESVDGRTVIVESNWLVVSAHLRDGDSATTRDIVLRVEKPAEATTTEPPPTTLPPATVEVPPVTETPPVQVVPPVPSVPEQTQGPAAPYYANCAAARAAGAAPLHVGEPGYRSGLDRDGDGVACET